MPPFIAYGLVCGIVLPACNGMQIDIIPSIFYRPVSIIPTAVYSGLRTNIGKCLYIDNYLYLHV